VGTFLAAILSHEKPSKKYFIFYLVERKKGFSFAPAFGVIEF